MKLQMIWPAWQHESCDFVACGRMEGVELSPGRVFVASSGKADSHHFAWPSKYWIAVVIPSRKVAVHLDVRELPNSTPLQIERMAKATQAGRFLRYAGELLQQAFTSLAALEAYVDAPKDGRPMARLKAGT